MKKLIMRLIILLLSIVLVLSMTGCPFTMKEIYDFVKYSFNVDDFRNTKWVCRDLDMYFYISDFGDVVGQYTDGDNTYYFEEYSTFSFIVFPVGEIGENSRYVDENGKSYIHKDDIFKYPQKGYVNFGTLYKDGVLILEVSSSDIGFWEDRDTSEFSFELEYEFAEDKTEKSLWHCEELNMNITSYDDGGFYMGDITLPDKKYKVCGFQAEKDVYDFKIQEFYEDAEFYSSENLVKMRLCVVEGELIAEIFDSHLVNPTQYPFWNYSKSEYVFEIVE